MADSRSDSLSVPTQRIATSDENNQRRVRAESLSDERLQRKVCERLTAAPEIDSSEITVKVRNRDVSLEGAVPSLRMKNAAGACAEWVLGIEQVHNLLQISPPPPDTDSNRPAEN